MGNSMTNTAPKTAPAAREARRIAALKRFRALPVFALAAVIGWASGQALLGPIGASAETAPVLQSKRAGDSNTSGAYLVGRFAQNVNDVATASHYMGMALERDPRNVALLSRVFALEISSGDVDSALELGQRLQETTPDHQLSALLLALEQARNGDYGESLGLDPWTVEV